MRRWVLAVVLSTTLAGGVPAAPAQEDGSGISQDRIAFGELPTAAEAAGGFMWVLDGRGGSIAKIDPATNEIVDEIRLEDVSGGSGWDLASARGSLWLTVPNRRRFVELDPATNEVLSTVRTGGHVSTVHSARGSLWFNHGTERRTWLVRMDPRSGETVARFPLGKHNAHAGDVVEYDGSVWVLRDNARHVAGTGRNVTFYVTASLWEIDPRSNEVVDKAPLGGTYTRGPVNPVIGDIEAARDGLWMSRVHERRLTLVNPHNARVLDVQSVPEFRLPWEIEVVGDDVWAGELNATRVVRIEPATDERTFVDTGGDTSWLGNGFGSLWAPVARRDGPGGEVVRLTPE